jgi:hypothetical protein
VLAVIELMGKVGHSTNVAPQSFAKRCNSATFIVDFGGFRLNHRRSRLNLFFSE